MAGVKSMRSVRGKYTSAGYAHTQERQMYIAKVRAGSAQDKLRDFNRIGYQSERPWNETPVPAFEYGSVTAPVHAPVREAKRQKTFSEQLLVCIRKEKRDFAVCCVLIVCIMMLAAVWGQKIVESGRIQHQIDTYQKDIKTVGILNEEAEKKLTIAKSGERIRNMAQNELHMLRPERGQTQTIYIQTADCAKAAAVQQNEEPGMEMLDILLGLLDTLNIGE